MAHIQHENDLHYTLYKVFYTPPQKASSAAPHCNLLSVDTSLPLTESEGLASGANNSSLDLVAAEKSVLVRDALEGTSGSSVLAGAEVVVVLDGVALLLGELRGERVFDVDEDVALDEGLGACLEGCAVSMMIILMRCACAWGYGLNLPILVLMAVSPTEPPS